MPNEPETRSSGEHPLPLSQKQEDLLLELFLQLEKDDRIKVVKLCRDLLRAAQKTEP